MEILGYFYSISKKKDFKIFQQNNQCFEIVWFSLKKQIIMEYLFQSFFFSRLSLATKMEQFKKVYSQA